MNGEGKSVGPISEKINHLAIRTSPIPGNKSDGRRKILLIHQVRRFAEIQEAVSRLEWRVVDDEASVRFRATPANISECPFQVHGDGHGATKMLPDVEMLVTRGSEI